MASAPILYILLTLTLLLPDIIALTQPPADSTLAPSVTTTTPSSSPEETSPEGLLQGSVAPTEVSNCSSSQNVTLEQMRIEAIKLEILDTLGLRRVPDAARLNASMQERRQILRLYEKSLAAIPAMRQGTVQKNDDDFRAHQFHSFTEQGDRPPGLGARPWTVPDRKRLYFSLDIQRHQDPNHKTMVKAAKLKLYKTDVRPRNLIHTDTVDNSVRIEVFQLLPGSSGGSGQDLPLLRRTLDSRLVSLTKSSWEEFDVSAAVQDWIRSPGSNLGLDVACDGRYRLNDLLDFVVWSQAARDRPYSSRHLPTLNVLTQQRNSLLPRRVMRSVVPSVSASGDCVQGSGEHRCCRYPLTLSFRNIGWESWIVHPREYQVYHCAGNCPSGYRVAHHFSRIKNLLNEFNPDFPLPVRCAPTRLLPIIVGHLNAEGTAMTVSAIENVIPEDCMCA